MQLSRPAAVLARLLPACDRDVIVGDLLEDAASRELTGTALTLWLCGECGQIAAGIAVDRARGCVMPPMREVAAGLAIEGSRTFRHARGGPIGALLSLLLVCASAVLIALSAEILIGTLFSVSYR
jgi:hypothetical protein